MGSKSKDELRMYILVNKNAKMSMGKVVSQTGHGISDMTETMVLRHQEKWKIYTKNGCAKIVLFASNNLIKYLYDKYADQNNAVWCVNVVDAGRTEVDEGTLTVLVFCPMKRVDAPEEFDRLRLIKN